MAAAAAAAPSPLQDEAASSNGFSPRELSATEIVWAAEQTRLRAKLACSDALGFVWPPAAATTATQLPQPAATPAASATAAAATFAPSLPPLRHVGGVDISFVGEPSTAACAALVVCEFPPAADGSMRVVYEDYRMVHMTEPYIPGFLAFREVQHLTALLDRMRERAPALFPQLLLVDGNGLLHPRGLGCASHLGVLADLPTIGVAKNLHMVDGLERTVVQARATAELHRGGDHFELVGNSGTVWGACMRSTDASSNPVFVSIGHRISLNTALQVVHACCQHRVPTPVRLADLGSRDFIRKGKAAAAAAAAAATGTSVADT